jgi:hypothetical protein
MKTLCEQWRDTEWWTRGEDQAIWRSVTTSLRSSTRLSFRELWGQVSQKNQRLLLQRHSKHAIDLRFCYHIAEVLKPPPLPNDADMTLDDAFAALKSAIQRRRASYGCQDHVHSPHTVVELQKKG